MEYHITLFVISILVGYIGTFSLLRWINSLNKEKVITFPTKVKCGLVMGLTVTGLHYLAMIASSISYISQNNHTNLSKFSIGMTMLAVGIGCATIMMVFLALLGSYIAKKITFQSLKLQTNEQYYQSLYQQNPDLILTFDLEGNIISTNNVIESYGYTEDEEGYTEVEKGTVQIETTGSTFNDISQSVKDMVRGKTNMIQSYISYSIIGRVCGNS